MSSEFGLRDWLLSEEPSSRRQAALSSWYNGWLRFRSNTLAMVGLCVLILIIFAAIFAPVLATHEDRKSVV